MNYKATLLLDNNQSFATDNKDDAVLSTKMSSLGIWNLLYKFLIEVTCVTATCTVARILRLTNYGLLVRIWWEAYGGSLDVDRILLKFSLAGSCLAVLEGGGPCLTSTQHRYGLSDLTVLQKLN